MSRRDIRIYDLYTGHIVVELRKVERETAIRAVRALIRPYVPSQGPEGVADGGWIVQPAVKVKIDGRWRWVGPQTANKMGVFPKEEAE
jgi:hypothetical protein